MKMCPPEAGLKAASSIPSNQPAMTLSLVAASSFHALVAPGQRPVRRWKPGFQAQAQARPDFTPLGRRIWVSKPIPLDYARLRTVLIAAHAAIVADARRPIDHPFSRNHQGDMH